MYYRVAKFLTAMVLTSSIQAMDWEDHNQAGHDSRVAPLHHASDHIASPLPQVNINRAINHIIGSVEEKINESLKKGYSLGWLFNPHYKDHVYNETRALAHGIISNFSSNFYLNLLDVIENDAWRIGDFGQLFSAWGFQELTELQPEELQLSQQIFAHPSGLILRLKPLQQQLALSIYTVKDTKNIINYLRDPSRHNMLQVKCSFAKKTAAESYKLYIARNKWHSGRVIVEPMPNRSGTVIPFNQLVNGYDITLANGQYAILQKYFNDYVLQKSHIRIGTFLPTTP